MKNENYQQILRNYIRAKDDNKPHLMSRVFSNSATLTMKVKTDAISFPADTIGLEAITDVLVRNFSQNFENVYTFCLTDSFSQSNSKETSCDWLVCMTDRADGSVRVGCGRYDWFFNDEVSLAERLVITIEQMQILSAKNTTQVMKWVGQLEYPFCDSSSVLELMPEIDLLDPIRNSVSSH